LVKVRLPMPGNIAESLEKSAFCAAETGGSWPERRTSLKPLKSLCFYFMAGQDFKADLFKW
jgi:hypothetical protein